MSKPKRSAQPASEKKAKDGFVERISDRMPDGRYMVVVRSGKTTYGGYVQTPPKIGATVPIERGVALL